MLFYKHQHWRSRSIVSMDPGSHFLFWNECGHSRAGGLKKKFCCVLCKISRRTMFTASECRYRWIGPFHMGGKNLKRFNKQRKIISFNNYNGNWTKMLRTGHLLRTGQLYILKFFLDLYYEIQNVFTQIWPLCNAL